MLNLLESITFLRFDRSDQTQRDLAFHGEEP